MEQKIVFLTGNKGKIKEAVAIIGDLISPWEEPIDLPEIQSTSPQEVLQAKIEAAKSVVDEPIIVEDTSLFLTDWGTGALPGPYIKDFLKTIDVSGLCSLAQRVGVKARAVTVLGYFDPGMREAKYFSGELIGEIVAEPRGTNGFGWDSSFMPAGRNQTLAEMADDEKNQISMRKQALEKLRLFLNQSE